ncbi:hypothetical protein QZH41_013097 [Actinostola sp. cb2023]|nr:hypothetical protein QZH41_013097 [Actinostola sp. cb2023]
MRVCGWVMRFIQNARATKAHRVRGPLTTREIETARLVWVKRAQASASGSDQFEEDKLQLNLQPNSEGVLECRGRIQGEYPVFLPDNQLYTQKVVMDAHLTTLHGGMGLTMAKLKLTPLHPPGNLPTDRTEGETPFQVIGVDYAGHIKYRGRGKTEGKAYVVLYACSLSRGLFLELLPNMETTEFLGSLKRLIARRGRPKKIYSDNGRTFIGAAKWIKQVMRDERVQDFLAQQQIHWQFNLSRAPWWGGQFERMVGLVKAALYKTIGNGMLSWKELQEVILDVEVTLNNRPLSYVEDDIQLPILTPNLLLYIQHNMLPDLQTHHVQDYDLRNRAKHLLKCKNALWSRWTTEYLRSLREQHRLKHKGDNNHPNEGEVVIIKSDEKNRGKWKLGIVDKLIVGKDGVVRGARLRAGKSFMERPIQHLYPMELSCDRTAPLQTEQLNPQAETFRPRRDAAAAARMRVQDIVGDED